MMPRSILDQTLEEIHKEEVRALKEEIDDLRVENMMLRQAIETFKFILCPADENVPPWCLL